MSEEIDELPEIETAAQRLKRRRDCATCKYGAIHINTEDHAVTITCVELDAENPFYVLCGFIECVWYE